MYQVEIITSGGHRLPRGKLISEYIEATRYATKVLGEAGGQRVILTKIVSEFYKGDDGVVYTRHPKFKKDDPAVQGKDDG